MSATKLVTRCPACRTAFRLVADQLRLRQGLVRCGRCQAVFDAREHMIVVKLPQAGTEAAPAPAAVAAGFAAVGNPVPAPSAMPAAGLAVAPSPVPASPVPSSVPLPVPAPVAASGPVAVESASESESEPPAAPTHFDPGYDPGYDVPALDAPTMIMGDTMPAPAPSSMPASPGLLPPFPHGGSARIEPSLPDAGAVHAPAAVTEAAEVTGAAEATAASEAADLRQAEAESQPALTHGLSDAVASEQVTRRWAREEPSSGPFFEPDFLRRARDRETARAREQQAERRTRASLWTVLAVLLVAALLQGTYLARSQLAGRFPALRPVLEAFCAPLGCAVPPWRDLDALRIESSQLQRQQEGSDEYVLAVTVRNNGSATTALPAIELVMTDLQDQLLLRRVLLPTEYLQSTQRGFADTGLRAGTELPLRVAFRTQQSAANYRVLLFYP